MRTKQSWAERIKKRNKLGFSLVELIVVIAIMAIMTAVLAPSLLSYVERSRAQKDNSAMSEVVNSIMLALADQNVYDEVLCYTASDNKSCYVDSLATYDASHASYTPTKKSGDTVLQYMFDDNARLEDENPYSPAGVMRGVTITFEPEQSTNKSCFVLYNGIINKFGPTDFIYGSMPETEANDDDELLLGGMASFGSMTNHYLYNRIRSTVGDKIELTSQTYRNSEYTVFIRMGTTGGNQADKQDAIKVYGQWNGTNLSYGNSGNPAGGGEPETPEVPGGSQPETPAPAGCDTLRWDGNTEGLEKIEINSMGLMITFYRVWNYVEIDPSLIENIGVIANTPDGAVDQEMTLDESMIDAGANAGHGWNLGGGSLILSDGQFTSRGTDGVVVPEGTWFATIDSEGFFMMTKSMTISGYDGFEHFDGCGHGNNGGNAGEEPSAPVGCDTLRWDGNTEGLPNVNGFLYKISDVVPTLADCVNGVKVTEIGGDTGVVDYETIQTTYDASGIVGCNYFMFIPEDGFVVGSMTFPEAGVYVPRADICITSITIPNFTGFPHSENCGHQSN